MTSGTAHTLYNLGYQTVDLVLSADGIYVDNRPMNQTKLVVHKGLNNQLNFHVRNRDRVKQNLSAKTLYATIINPNTSMRVIFKPLTLVSGGTTGEARLDLDTGDIQDLAPGLYQISISESADSGLTQSPLYANQNDRIMTDLEVMSSLEYDPSPTQSVTNFIRTGSVGIDGVDSFATSSLYGNQDKNFRHSRHTLALYMTNFVGTVRVQGSALASAPSLDSDWYDINVQGDIGSPAIPYATATSGVDPFNFTINTNWIRIIFDQTSGTLDQVLLRN
jgi:hypothetical protein|tara:strand:+ start:4795 stop:5625 length:831 start_codon:yes stop_codon:yes gene_type:complete